MARPVLRTTARGKQGPVGPQGPEGPPGPQGERGLPGVNAVPADEAVAGYIEADDSATHGALTGGFVTKTVSNGASLVELLSPTDRKADTSRLRIVSSQKQEPENNANGGETVWLDLENPLAKSMLTWRIRFDPATRLPYAAGMAPPNAPYRRVVWAGAHYLAQDQVDDDNPTDIHGHWSVEVPDSTLALRTRFEIPFVHTKSGGQIGTDKTNIQTNMADFTVRAGSTEREGLPTCRLRIAGLPDSTNGSGDGREKILEWSADSAGYNDTKKRFQFLMTRAAETGDNNGSNFVVRRYADDGSSLGATMTINRRYGNFSFGGNADSLYPARAHATWGSDRLGDHGFMADNSESGLTGAGFFARLANGTRSAFAAQKQSSSQNDFVIRVSGAMEWGTGSASRDVQLYRMGEAGSGRLVTDGDLELLNRKAIILADELGGRWRIQVDSSGTLSAAAA